MKKTIYTLNVDGYAPEITALTYPLMHYYADKIGADIYVIKERKFPDWPVTYEKLQIYELARQHKNDWNIYIDSDAIVHPETIDWTAYLKKDTVAHNGSDMANLRWRYNEYFLRDGRDWGSCNWLTIASDWCVDVWRPLECTPAEAISNIFPTVDEYNTVITREHLIDDYALSCNIARFGLKARKLMDVQKEVGFPEANFFWHAYTISVADKVEEMKKLLINWKIPEFIKNYE